MAYQIKATHDSDTKPNYLGVLTATPDFADGQLGLFLSADVGGAEVAIFNGYLRCLQRIREAGWPNPGAGNFNTIVFDVAESAIKSETYDSTIPALDPTDIALIQGSGFTVSHDSNSGHIRRMIEAMKERYLGDGPYVATPMSWRYVIPSDNYTVRIPTQGAFEYDAIVDWGDGNVNELTGSGGGGQNPQRDHTYATAGTYDVQISGLFPGMAGSSGFPGAKPDGWEDITEFLHWGLVGLETCDSIFLGASNMEYAADDDPPPNALVSMSRMFELTAVTGTQGNWDWDTSDCTTMFSLFLQCSSFQGNAAIEGWDTSNVVDMFSVFAFCPLVDMDLSAWDTSSADHMRQMFDGCALMNFDMSGWDTSNVRTMGEMFQNCTAFELTGVENWDISGLLVSTQLIFPPLDSFGDNCGCTPAQYDAILANFAAQSPPTLQGEGISFGMAGVTYTAAGQADRDILTNPPNEWVITDAGVAP